MPPATGGMRFLLGARASGPHHGSAFTCASERARGPRSRMIWRVGAIVIAGIVALPLLGVASSLFTPQGELWRHLADTQLIDIFFNTLVLLLVVGLGTTIIGAGTAWLVTMCSFPGSRLLQWALLLPLVLPTYIIGYAYADLLAFAGPVQGALRQATGWSRGDYWFPDLGSAGGVALLFTLVLYPYVYLAARTAFLSQSHALIEASRILGHGPWRTFFGVAPAAGAARRRRRRGAGAPGGARRLRHRPILRRADLHDGDLSDLVRAGQSRGRRADRARPDRHRRPPDPDRAPFARPRPLPHRLEPAPPRRARRACVLAGGWRDRGLRAAHHPGLRRADDPSGAARLAVGRGRHRLAFPARRRQQPQPRRGGRRDHRRASPCS